MSYVALRAERIAKRYRINERSSRYDTLRDWTAERLRSLAKRARGTPNARPVAQREIWALQDVSFEIAQGDVVGVIGPNGAGKSTLLKVLSRITEPTSGSAMIKGRVGSLLEVGTGFHLELTARENIYLNSAILGMPRSRTVRVFDEIVDFAEIERFVDTPVKHYSSGMYLKLAFSVAAHLEPDVLMVDEVLAVGDVAFQRKCLGKMGEVSRHGRTVLFVSHNMSAVSELCRSGLLMLQGRGTRFDTAPAAVAAYLTATSSHAAPDDDTSDATFQVGRIRIDESFEHTVRAGDAFCVSLPVRARQVSNPLLFLIVEDSRGRTVIHDRVTSRGLGVPTMDGEMTLEIDMPPLWLSPGAYSLYFKFLLPLAGEGEGRRTSERAVLHITGDYDQTGNSVLNPPLAWRLDRNAGNTTAP
jgi:lipopolysaccharide transport system ATP-binding protein